jgi:hypothetical protein
MSFRFFGLGKTEFLGLGSGLWVQETRSSRVGEARKFYVGNLR